MGRFKPNPRFEEELRREPGVRALLKSAAEQTVARASGEAHRKFSSGFYVDDDGETVTAGTTNPFFHLEEWGSANNPPRATLRKAARATGARLEESGP